MYHPFSAKFWQRRLGMTVEERIRTATILPSAHPPMPHPMDREECRNWSARQSEKTGLAQAQDRDPPPLNPESEGNSKGHAVALGLRDCA